MSDSGETDGMRGLAEHLREQGGRCGPTCECTLHADDAKAVDLCRRYAMLRRLRDLDVRDAADTADTADEDGERGRWEHLVGEYVREWRELASELEQVATRAMEARRSILDDVLPCETTPVCADDVNARYSVWKTLRTVLRERLVPAGYYTRRLGGDMLELAWTAEALQRVRIIETPSGPAGPRYVVTLDDAAVSGEIECVARATAEVSRLVGEMTTLAREQEILRRA